MDEATRTQLEAAGLDRIRALRRPRAALAILAVLVLAGGAIAVTSGGGGKPARKHVARHAKPPRPEEPLRRHPKVVQLEGAGSEAKPRGDLRDSGPSPGAPSDAQVRADLREARRSLRSFKHYLASTAFLPTSPRANVLRDGTAVAPDDAPEIVKRVILAGNEIAKFPYKWGGGHGAWRDNGYDCSGSVSFALAGAGLLNRPLTSGAFMGWGEPGPGKWVTIYANPGHIFMFVAGLRFDTSGQGRAGTRWQEGTRGAGGFEVRHIPGL